MPPLLILLGGCALVAPAIVLRSRLSHRQVWTRGLALICVAHFVVSIMIFRAIPPHMLGQGNFTHPVYLGPFLICALPCIAFLPSDIFVSLGLAGTLLLVLFNSLLWSVPVTALCFFRKWTLAREERERKRTIETAIAKMTKEGVAEGTKSPYVPQKPWKDTNRPHKGYYGSG